MGVTRTTGPISGGSLRKHYGPYQGGVRGPPGGILPAGFTKGTTPDREGVPANPVCREGPRWFRPRPITQTAYQGPLATLRSTMADHTRAEHCHRGAAGSTSPSSHSSHRRGDTRKEEGSAENAAALFGVIIGFYHLESHVWCQHN